MVGKYFVVQLKRISKLLPKVVLVSIAFILCILLVGSVVINTSSFSTDKLKYSIGVCGTKEDNFLSLGLSLLESVDDMQYMLDIKEFDTVKEAEEAIKKGDITAYAVIPEGFVDSINYMTNDSQIVYYTSAGQKGITNVLMDEIADLASSVILYSEAGIFTLWDIMEENGASVSDISAETDNLFVTFMLAILGRAGLTETEELGISLGLSTYTYFIVSLSLFYILLLSFSGLSFFTGQSLELKKIVYTYGVSAGKQTGCEYVCFLVMNFVCTFLFEAALYVALKISGYTVSEFKNGFDVGFRGLCAVLVPIVIMFSAFEYFIFEAVDKIINKLLAGFMIFISFAYFSGYFYPKAFMPPAIRAIGEILPTGSAFTFVSYKMTGKFNVGAFAYVVAYFLIFIVGSIFVRQLKISGGGKE